MKALVEMYAKLHSGNLHILKDVYRDDIRFVDPAHEIDGIANLTQYFEQLYSNVQSIDFTFEESKATAHSGFVRWQMIFSHKRIAGGRPVKVDGVTFVEMDDEGKVYYHRDYFDLGAMVYENIPLLGRLIRRIRGGLGQ